MVFELTFKILTPIITTTDIHLDAVFSAISPSGHNKDYVITRHTPSRSIKQLNIPIDCAKINNRFIFCCSVANFHNAETICDTACKRKSGEDVLYYHKNITRKTGIEKDSMIKLYGVSCDCVSFLLSSSNKSSVIRYAKRVNSIGGMRKQGYGQVTDFKLTERPDLSWKDCIVSNGKAIRNIPSIFIDGPCHSKSRCLCPYFLLDGKEPCATVGDFVKIKDDVFLSPFKR